MKVPYLTVDSGDPEQHHSSSQNAESKDLKLCIKVDSMFLIISHLVVILKEILVNNFDDVWDHVPHFSWYQAAVTLYASIFAFIAGIWLIYPIFSMYKPSFECSKGWTSKPKHSSRTKSSD